MLTPTPGHDQPLPLTNLSLDAQLLRASHQTEAAPSSDLTIEQVVAEGLGCLQAGECYEGGD